MLAAQRYIQPRILSRDGLTHCASCHFSGDWHDCHFQLPAPVLEEQYSISNGTLPILAGWELEPADLFEQETQPVSRLDTQRRTF